MELERRTRPATSADARLIAYHRSSMFLDMGTASRKEVQSLQAATEPYLHGLLGTQDYLGWIVEVNGQAVASGGLYLRELAPFPGCHRIGTWAHIANIYTEPTHRRHGMARELMHTMLAWCAANDINQITLTASEQGKSLYESFGFLGTADMRLPQKK